MKKRIFKIVIALVIPVVIVLIMWFRLSSFERAVITTCHGVYRDNWGLSGAYIDDKLEWIRVEFSLKNDEKELLADGVVETYQSVIEFYKEYFGEHEYSFMIGFYDGYFPCVDMYDIDLESGTYGLNVHVDNTMEELAKLFPDSRELKLYGRCYDTVDELGAFTKLEAIYFYNYECSDEELEKIQEMFPGCEVSFRK